MLETYTVSFFGHRRIDNALRLEEALEGIVCFLLREKEYVEFLVGRDGEFDLLAACAIKRCKRKTGDHNSSLVWVLPYPTAELRDNEESFRNYYDKIEIFDSSAENHFKAAIQIRNCSMVDRSDLVVFCVERKSGGAYRTMRYAMRKNIPLINIGEEWKDQVKATMVRVTKQMLHN